MGRWRAYLIIVATLALSACGEPSDEGGGSNTLAQGGEATVDAGGGPASSEAPATSAREVAQRLVDSDGIAEEIGFTVRQAIACDGARLADSASYICTAQYNDAERGGQPALVVFRLYDRGTDYEERKADLKQRIIDMPGQWEIAAEPTVTLSVRDGGKHSIRNVCMQSRGVENSPAYCIVEAHPTILVETIVAPLEGSSDSVRIGGEDRSSEVDTDRASNLAILATGLVAGMR